MICRPLSTWPRLESATGRARKRRRRKALIGQQRIKNGEIPNNANSSSDEMERRLPYPKNKPWLVLWPDPYYDPNKVEKKVQKPSRPWRNVPGDLRKAWVVYASTWNYGSRDDESAALNQQQDSDKGQLKFTEISDNLNENLSEIRKDGASILEQAQERTGVRSYDDLKVLAADWMKLANECLREFMAGYREGRDKEIDKMLHEYFQEEKSESKTETESSNRKRRRKPKIRILRD